MSDIKTYEPLWGTWYIDSLLGEGGFGKVYKVRREEFGTTYYSAVKIISIPHDESEILQMRKESLDDESIKRYLYAFVTDILSEINLMRQFRGTGNIVSLEDHQVIDRATLPKSPPNPAGTSAMASIAHISMGWDILIRMELLTSLSDHAMQTPLTEGEVIKLGIHICRALELCAQRNTIHRDIKPDNIFISPYGEYKLGDFGIARQLERTSSGLSKKGTYTYMAPEVFRGEQYGSSVDTYSLGIVLYYFLNRNRTPFLPDFPHPIMPKDRDEALFKRMNGAPLPVLKGVSPGLNDIVWKACAYNRQERFASPTEMRKALEGIEGLDQTYAVPGQIQNRGDSVFGQHYTPSTLEPPMPDPCYAASAQGQNYGLPRQNQNYPAPAPGSMPQPSEQPPYVNPAGQVNGNLASKSGKRSLFIGLGITVSLAVIACMLFFIFNHFSADCVFRQHWATVSSNIGPRFPVTLGHGFR